MAHRVVSLAGEGGSGSSPRRVPRTAMPPLPRSSRSSSAVRPPVPSGAASSLRPPAPSRVPSSLRPPVPSRVPSSLRPPVPSRVIAKPAGGDLATALEMSFPRPEPKLVVPIVAPLGAHPFFTRTGPSPLPGPAPLADGVPARDRLLPTFTREIIPPAVQVSHDTSSSPSAVRPRPRGRWTDFLIDHARALEVLGFAVAWILTAGAAAVVVGHVLEHSEMPAVVWLPTSSQSASSDATSCASPSQPPEVAVDSLPPATSCESPRAVASPARISPPHRGSGLPVRRAPAPSAGPKTLADWMRDAVR